jgi:hypothetical protein
MQTVTDDPTRPAPGPTMVTRYFTLATWVFRAPPGTRPRPVPAEPR